MEAAKRRFKFQLSSSPKLQLDRLISYQNSDIMMLLAEYMDVKALVRLGMVCSRLNLYVLKGTYIHASILHTFPGIDNVPKGKDEKIAPIYCTISIYDIVYR
jgi:hypothetical protein